MIRADGGAVLHSTEWTVNGSAAQGRKMVREYSKLMLRAYNAEADNLVRGLKPYKLDAAIERLRKVAETIRRLGATMGIRISDEYQALRVYELEVTADEYHPGLIVMPSVARDRQAQLLDAALAFIEQEAAATSQSPRDLMLNHVVEVDSAGTYLVPRRARSFVSVTAPSTATPAFNDSESLPVTSRLAAAYARHP
jgi:Domain of unknown function (DUF4041)